MGGSYCDYYERPDSRFRTMCPFVLPGFERQRTLSGAAKHVFKHRYEPR